MKPLFKSFFYAWRGFREAMIGRNFRIQMVAGVVIIILAVALRASYLEDALLAVAVGLVLGGEAMNTAIEELSNFVSPTHRAEIRIIKDLMAAAVLIFSVVAAFVGIIIFGKILFGI